MNPENVQEVITALRAYGQAAREDDSELDGKTIQQDMGELAHVLESDGTYTEGDLIERLGITKTNTGYEWS